MLWNLAEGRLIPAEGEGLCLMLRACSQCAIKPFAARGLVSLFCELRFLKNKQGLLEDWHLKGDCVHEPVITTCLFLKPIPAIQAGLAGHSYRISSHRARHLLTRAPRVGWAVFTGAVGGLGVMGIEAEPGLFVEILL